MAPMKQPTFDSIMAKGESMAAQAEEFEIAEAFRTGIPPRNTFWERYDEIVDKAFEALSDNETVEA